MTTLSDFYALISAEVNKGTRFDATIPQKVKQAVQFFERNYSFAYMEASLEYTISATANPARRADLPSRFKLPIWHRYKKDDGSLIYLSQVSGEDVSKHEDKAPTGYWIEGRSYIWFDNQTDEDLSAEFYHYAFSDYTSWSPATENLWLIDNAEALVIAQTMVYLAPTARESGWIEAYGGMVQTELNTTIRLDEDLRSADADLFMNYGRVR